MGVQTLHRTSKGVPGIPKAFPGLPTAFKDRATVCKTTRSGVAGPSRDRRGAAEHVPAHSMASKGETLPIVSKNMPRLPNGVPGPSSSLQSRSRAFRDLPGPCKGFQGSSRGLPRPSGASATFSKVFQDLQGLPGAFQGFSGGLPRPYNGFQRRSRTLQWRPRSPTGPLETQPRASKHLPHAFQKFPKASMGVSKRSKNFYPLVEVFRGHSETARRLPTPTFETLQMCPSASKRPATASGGASRVARRQPPSFPLWCSQCAQVRAGFRGIS